VGQISERTDLLRILLADQDDANAFLFQCGVNRLSRSCSFQRVAARAQFPEKFQTFRPNILIAAGDFALPDVLKEMKQITNGHPIICAVKTVVDGEAAIAAGAADCVLTSQVDELPACIERHLKGGNQVPYFKKDLAQNKSGKAKTPSTLDLKLQEFDRRVGASLKRFGKTAQMKFQKLARVTSSACITMDRALRRHYRALKVQWLLHKQKRLVQSAMPADISTDQPSGARINSVTSSTHSLNQERLESSEPSMPRFVSPTPHKQAAPLAETETSDTETLRTLELSFKALFHTSLDPMFLVDGLGSFLHANAPACALLGVAPAELLGKSLLDFVPALERPQVSSMWEALLIEGRQKGECRFQSAAGENREVLISARTNLWFGVHLIVAHDQTELKSLRNAMQHRQQAA
jgi:PAS domain S-box-containing protein